MNKQETGSLVMVLLSLTAALILFALLTWSYSNGLSQRINNLETRVAEIDRR
jgi:hypothetical protein